MTSNAIGLIIMAAALMFGAVEIWSAVPVLLAVYTVSLVWVFRKGYEDAEPATHIRLLVVCAALFVGLAVVQLVPLPHGVMKLIAPHTAALREYYAAGPLAAAPLSLNPSAGLGELTRLFAFLAVFLVSAFHFQKPGSIRRFTQMMVIFGFVLAVFSILQKATGSTRIYWLRELTAGGTPFGPFVNRNHFAGFIGMLVPLGLGAALSSGMREKKILYGFMSVIMAVSLFLSLSRGGVIGFFGGIAAFAFMMTVSSKEKKLPWAVGLFLLVLFSYLIYLGISPVIDRFYHTDISQEDRLVVWSSTLRAFGDFWLLGSGLGTFVNVYPLYASIPLQALYDHAHNDYLELLLETGIAGVLIVLCAAVILATALVRSPKQGHAGITRASLVAALLSMLVHSIFDFNLHILSNLLLFGVILGMLAARAIVTDEDRVQSAGEPEPARKTPESPWQFIITDIPWPRKTRPKQHRRRRRPAAEDDTGQDEDGIDENRDNERP